MSDFKILIAGLWKLFTIWWPAIIFITVTFIHLSKAEKETEKNKQAIRRAEENQRRAA